MEHGQARQDNFLALPFALRGKPPDITAGTVIGPYTLDVPLGAGGMGSVWHARRTDGRFEGAVAVKLLHLAALDAGGAERFRREGTLLARLSHPHIAQLFDAGVTRRRPAVSRPRVHRGRARSIATPTTHRLDVRARLDLFHQVADAVAHAHAHSVVHRDLKPSNVLVDAEAR